MRSLMVFFAAVAVSSILVMTCEKNPTEGTRCGAVCNDGTTSDATGSGACSYHGGVDHWIYCD